jgi:hypothetical protein
MPFSRSPVLSCSLATETPLDPERYGDWRIDLLTAQVSSYRRVPCCESAPKWDFIYDKSERIESAQKIDV